MNSRAETGKTKSGEPYVQLVAEDALPPNGVILKAYLSPDGAKLRVVLPDLSNFSQTRIDVDSHYVEFTRDAAAARRELDKKK